METKSKSKTILQKYKKAKSRRQAVRDPKWVELDAFDRNEQWSLTGAPSWLPKPVTNFVHLVKYTKRAALAVDNPTGKLRAVSPAGVQRVDQLNRAFQDTWDRIKARKVVRQNIETSKLLGDGIAHVFWNENEEGTMGTTVLGDAGYHYEGEIKIKEVDPSSFYPDPTAFTIEDCQFIHVVERKPMDWVKKNPKFKDVLSSSDNIESTNAPEERGEIYSNRDYTTEADGLVDFHWHYTKEPNEEGGFTYKVAYLAGEKFLLEENLRPNRYPFAILRDFPQRQSFWSMSTCEFILDNQKIINKVESIIAMIGTLMQNPQKIVWTRSGIDPREVTKYGNAPGHTFSSNEPGSNAITYVQPPNIPPVLFNLLENAKANIREITGLNEAYMGQNVGSLQTSGGVNSLIERATMRDRDQMFDIEMYIEDLTKLIIDFMVTYYDQERQIRIMGPNPDQYSFEPFIGISFNDLAYDVAVDVSSKAPITRMKESQDADNLLNAQGQYAQSFPTSIITPQEYVKMKGFSNADQIIQRMNAEEMRNKTEEAMQVAMMAQEALNSGVPQPEVEQMMNEMFTQMEQQASGIGSANTGAVQNQQAGL